ncbi:arylesterase [uncultured Cohaesibacter sp.]|uniref:arylesterase n=1 Tax=uncultured Cohaesibacter sp. TaxID=1002546 RepID=UPI002AAB8F59|nr:arylesterase [uncultured Cohaesibacter sp.]
MINPIWGRYFGIKDSKAHSWAFCLYAPKISLMKMNNEYCQHGHAMDHLQSPHRGAATTRMTSHPAHFYLSFFLLLLLGLFTMTSAQAADTTRLLAFGDSLSAGYQLPAGEDFPTQLQQHLKNQGHNVEIVNASVSGDTTASGLSRLDWSTPENIDLVLLELGANDALQGLSIDNAKANLAAMIEKFQQKGIKVALMGMRAPPNMGADYTSAFDAIYPALANEYQIPLYPFFLEDVAAEPDLNLQDGMHPNQKGIQVIVKNIAPFVIDLLNQPN